MRERRGEVIRYSAPVKGALGREGKKKGAEQGTGSSFVPYVMRQKKGGERGGRDLDFTPNKRECFLLRGGKTEKANVKGH